MSAIRAILLDLYDTMAWTEWSALRGEIERRLGISEADLLRAFLETNSARGLGTFGSLEGDLRAVLEAAGVRARAQTIRELVERTEVFLANGVHLWDDSIPTLRELRSRGIRTAIVSNCDHATRGVVERLALEEEADAVILSFEVGAAKPAPGIYRTALEALHAGADEALFVDDQVAYCDGAAEVGMRTLLLVRSSTRGPAAGSTRHPVVRNLGALLELL